MVVKFGSPGDQLHNFFMCLGCVYVLGWLAPLWGQGTMSAEAGLWFNTEHELASGRLRSVVSASHRHSNVEIRQAVLSLAVCVFWGSRSLLLCATH